MYSTERINGIFNIAEVKEKLWMDTIFLPFTFVPTNALIMINHH